MTGVALLHSLCYYSVNLINSKRPSAALNNFETIVDGWIPYLGWTWIFYYLGDIYVLFFGSYLVWKLSEAKFYRAVMTYVGVIIGGALVQIALPAESPWPKDLTSVQQFFHNFFSSGPYACLPSMHVVLIVLPACLSLSVLRFHWLKAFSILLAILITISTLTLKEHFFLDTLTGGILGLLSYGFWRLDFKKLFKK